MFSLYRIRDIVTANQRIINSLKLNDMTYKEAKDMAGQCYCSLYAISPELICSCDELYDCQNCVEAYEEGKRIRLQNLEDTMNRGL